MQTNPSYRSARRRKPTQQKVEYGFPVLLILLVATSSCTTEETGNQPTPKAARGVAHLVSESAVSVPTLIGNGRNIMRSPDGHLIGTFLRRQGDTSEVVFVASADDGQTWLTHVAPMPATGPASPAVDSNYNGAYLVFIDQDGGHLLQIPDPHVAAIHGHHHGPLTPPGLAIKHSFIAASRDGWGAASTQAKSVVYGWVDSTRGDFHVGVAEDGKTFPMTKVIHRDPYAVSGPSVSIRDHYVFMTYQTKNPSLLPRDIPAASDTVGGVHYAWMESTDGGKTWTAAKPLFPTVTDFPKIHALRIDKNGNEYSGVVRAAGGSIGAEDFSQALAWKPGAENGIMFVTTAQTPVTLDDGIFPAHYWNDTMNRIGVVSFKEFYGGDTWTHVIANRLLSRIERERNIIESRGTQHQYSALPLTPVRAVSSVEVVTDAAGAETRRIAVSFSTNAGKSFAHIVDFDERSLVSMGDIQLAPDMIIEVSQCLFADRDGDIYVDLLLFRGSDGPVHHLKLPLGINLDDVPQSF